MKNQPFGNFAPLPRHPRGRRFPAPGLAALLALAVTTPALAETASHGGGAPAATAMLYGAVLALLVLMLLWLASRAWKRRGMAP
jgi:hypothetical protein